MKSKQSPPLSSNLQSKSKDSQFKPAYNFMSELSQSQMAYEQQQHGEDYNQIYKALSSGVYQSSGAYQVEEDNEQKEEQQEHQKKQRDISDDQQITSQKKEKLHESQHEAIKNSQQPIYEQIVTESTKSNQNKLPEQQVQFKQKLQAIEDNKPHEQQQQFFFAQSMSHYESVMQFAHPSIMEQSTRHNQQDYKLNKIEQQGEINQQTNEIHIDINKSIQISHKSERKQSLPIPPASLKELKIGKLSNKISFTEESSQKVQKMMQKNNPKDFSFIKQELNKFSCLDQKEKISIAISGYEKQYFLKMETQLYHIEVHKEDQKYTIKRRFSDFVALEELVRLQYPGFIIYPFPENSIEYFKKMKLSMGSEQEKIVLTQKRLFQLQKYVNFLFSHSQISASFLLQVFIQENPDFFQKQMNNIQSISLSQERDLHLGIIEKNINTIKKLVRSNFKFLNAYFEPEDLKVKQNLQTLQGRCNKGNDRFGQIRSNHETFILRLDNFSSKIQRLATIFKNNSQIPNLQCSIDSVLIFSSKISSSRPYYEKYSQFIQENLISDVIHYDHLLKNIGSLLNYRQQLINKVNSLQTQHYSLGEKLQEKISLFDNRFAKDWSYFCEQFQKNIAILYQKFNLMWKNHCTLMSKIWK